MKNNMDNQQITREIIELRQIVNRLLTILGDQNHLSDLIVFNKRIQARNITADGNGLQILPDSSKKLGFYGVTPIAQPQSTGETTGASDVTLNNATTFTGNYGTRAYTVLDLVKHLKTLGILKKDN